MCHKATGSVHFGEFAKIDKRGMLHDKVLDRADENVKQRSCKSLCLGMHQPCGVPLGGIAGLWSGVALVAIARMLRAWKSVDVLAGYSQQGWMDIK